MYCIQTEAFLLFKTDTDHIIKQWSFLKPFYFGGTANAV